MKEEEINLNDLLDKVQKLPKFLLSKWKPIILFGILGAIIGITITFLIPKTYLSKLSFIVEEEKSSSTSSLVSVASAFGIGGSTSSGLFSSPNIMTYLTTKDLVKKALLKPINGTTTTFVQEYINANYLYEKWEEYPNLKDIKFKINDNPENFSLQKDSILRSIYIRIIDKEELVVTKPIVENNFIDIQVNTKSEKFSRYFPEVLIDIVGDYYTETKIKKSKQNVSILQKQVDSVLIELNRDMYGAAASSDNIFGLNPAMNVKRVPITEKQISVQTNSAILTEMIKNLELSKLELFKQTPLIQVIDKPELPLLFFKISKIIALIVGALLFSFLTITALIFKKIFKKNT
jgi:hypothetical protein